MIRFSRPIQHGVLAPPRRPLPALQLNLYSARPAGLPNLLLPVIIIDPLHRLILSRLLSFLKRRRGFKVTVKVERML